MKIYQGDIGIALVIATGLTLTGASVTTLKVKKPSGALVTWNATIDPGNATQLIYTTGTNDLNENGVYFIQASVTLGAQVLFGETVPLTVYGAYQ
jgi:hypothetical protein